MNILIVHKKLNGNCQSYYFFVREMAERFAMENSIATDHYSPDLEISGNTSASITFLRLPDKTGLSLSLWYRTSLFRIVKRLNITKVIYLNTLPFCKLSIPEIGIYADVSFVMPQKNELRYKQMLRNKFGEKIRDLQKIITYSEYAADQLGIRAGEDFRHKINVIYGAATYPFLDRSFNEKEIRKDNLTQGEEFFLAKLSNENDDDFITLLKAFSSFKKWQKSNMKLVVSGFESGLHSSLKRKLSSYKYASDVLVLTDDHTDIYPEILSAAYAFLLLTYKDCDTIPVFEALQSGTLLIAPSLPSIKEIAKNEFIEISTKDQETISRLLINAYQNESLSETMAANGMQLAQQYSYDSAKNAYQGVFEN